MIFVESGFKYKKEIESNDVQNWMQGNCDNYTFTKHLLKRSYVKEEDLPIFLFPIDLMRLYFQQLKLSVINLQSSWN